MVQTSFLGDVILTTPIFAELRARFPEAQLYALVRPEARQLLECDPNLEDVLTFDKYGVERGISGILKKSAELQRIGFQRAYILQRSFRSALLLRLSRIPETYGFKTSLWSRLFTYRVPRDRRLHDVLRNLSILGDNQFRTRPEIKLYTKAASGGNQTVLSELATLDKLVCVFPGSVWYTKRWNEQNYAELISRIERAGCQVAVVGGDSELALLKRVAMGTQAEVVAGFELSSVMKLVQGSKLVICNDSMAFHLAQGLGTPAVAIYCSTSPGFGFGAFAPNAECVEETDLRCKPCSRHGMNYCPLGHEMCMKLPSSATVFEAAMGKLRCLP